VEGEINWDCKWGTLNIRNYWSSSWYCSGNWDAGSNEWPVA